MQMNSRRLQTQQPPTFEVAMRHTRSLRRVRTNFLATQSRAREAGAHAGDPSGPRSSPGPTTPTITCLVSKLASPFPNSNIVT
eukprot:CAMPEP_0206503916 /NCGR_PEP_ID=MMETSP0324_2-20121206/55087_1 /ASSEMBLY_ACC=CAM_ASM_000836 /TAXON_ID=2866 /ORGANISM="Crypthecodinium cohnii, Strain Seligo" /LENGTH=82 /DNA_ID=CAMNT_0053992811 /DNA_START=356 /DNA_END=604 /DNA_ORIENTATION=+